VSRECEQDRVEADGIARAFQHRTLEIVIQQDTWTSLEGFECRDMAAQEVLDASIKEETKEYPA
jgi:hypothetical protein